MSEKPDAAEDEALTREAAVWFERVHDDKVSVETLAAWQAWMEQSEANREAFRRIEDIWATTGRLPLP